MRRFLSTVAFCAALLVFGLFVLLPKSQAEKNLLQNLLNLPAPPPPNPLVPVSRRNQAEDFFNKSKPPADDASLEDILAYWQIQSATYNDLGYNVKPSDKSLERILGDIEQKPERLANFLNVLPENSATVDFVKRLYDQKLSDDDYSSEWKSSVKEWLTFHSNYFSSDLVKVADRIADENGYVQNQDELLALARVDWDKAEPIVQRLYNNASQPVSQVLARWVLYRHALDTDSIGDTDRYRDELKAMVENKSVSPAMRDLAMDALAKEKEWQGRDDWYLSLLGDETLADLRLNGQHYTGLTTLVMTSPPDKYVEKMLRLVQSSNAAIRGAAVRNLAIVINDKNPDVIRALLPWLEDANWVEETNGERRMLINALQRIKMPESVPGLIAVLNEKQTRDVSLSMSGNSSTMNSNVMIRPPIEKGDTTEFYQYRSEAVQALITQRDARAANALRLILPQVEDWQRGNVVRALIASRGFSVSEEIDALELIAKNYKQADDTVYPSVSNSSMSNMMMSNSVRIVRDMPSMMPPPPPMPVYRSEEVVTNMSIDSYPNAAATRAYNPADIKPMLAAQLISQQEPEEELVTALIDRINFLDAKEPATALGLRQIMKNWRGAAINALMLRDLKADKADTDSVVKLLSLRKELRENQSNEVFDARGGTATALGITSCILEDANNYEGILESESVESKIAMLACARLIRAELPLRKVAENLRSPNKLLALASESYLETQDSAEARTIVLSLHPNEAKILGAKWYFATNEGYVRTADNFLSQLFASVNDSYTLVGYYNSSGEIDAVEKKLQKEVRENQELLGVYAYDKNFIRIYKDKAVFSWEEDKARYRERDLTKDEFDRVKGYLATERASELPPFLSDCNGEDDCEPKELLMLGRQGGRRVFERSGTPPKFFAELDAMFTEMRRPPAKLHYWLEKNIAGLEILFEDENLQAEAVWKTGDDFRLLLNDEVRRKQIDKELDRLDESEEENAVDSETDYEKMEAERIKRRQQRLFENYGWYKFAGGKLAGLTEQPAQAEFLPKHDGSSIRAEDSQWKARAAAFEIRANDEGLYKIARGQATRLREGFYDKPVVTPNGRWMLVKKYSREDYVPHLVRFNLLTNKEATVKLDEHPVFEPVAFIPSLGKILIFGGNYRDNDGGYDEDVSERDGEFYLLDPETGIVQKTKGETRPLAQQTYRPLQATANADEFWAAIPDEDKEETQVGVYNAKTLAFKSLLKIPQITFNSMQMWVDAGKVYFVYEGHLLALPLGKVETAPAASNPQ